MLQHIASCASALKKNLSESSPACQTPSRPRREPSMWNGPRSGAEEEGREEGELGSACRSPCHLRTPWSSAPGRCAVASPALCCQSTSCNMLILTLSCLFLKTQQSLVGAQMGGIWYKSLCLHPAKTGSGNGSGSVGGGKLCWVLREPSCWKLLRSKQSRNSAELGEVLGGCL